MRRGLGVRREDYRGHGNGDCSCREDAEEHPLFHNEVRGEMFAKTLGGLIEKPPGKPALVPLSDKRPAIHTDNVRSEFKTIMEEN